MGRWNIFQSKHLPFPLFLWVVRKAKWKKWSNIQLTLHTKWSFPLRMSSVNVTKSQETADLVTFTEEILTSKTLFFVFISSSSFPIYTLYTNLPRFVYLMSGCSNTSINYSSSSLLKDCLFWARFLEALSSIGIYLSDC